MFKRISALALLVCSACVMSSAVPTENENLGVDANQLETQPTGKGATNKAAHGGNGGNGILYHGGPVMLNTTNVYYIWYGNWNGNTATSILTDFANSVGGSPYFNINTTYYDGTNTHVANSVVYAGSMVDSYSRGVNLSDSDVGTIVSSALLRNALPTDLHGVYFVLTSADVHETSGFCASYCGWHSYNSSTNIKYAFIGNPDQCQSSCAAQNVSPNNNAGADGMASIIAHELEESVTDPNLNAWYDRRGYECSDKCAWSFGSTYTTINGSKANMHLGSRDYLIQQNWVNVGSGYCSLSY